MLCESKKFSVGLFINYVTLSLSGSVNLIKIDNGMNLIQSSPKNHLKFSKSLNHIHN
jgi:hypothetical protein